MKLKTAFFQKVFLILLGIFLSFFLIEAGLRLGGFTLLAVQEHRNRVAVKKGGAYRILCLGESTTQAQWPPFLEAALNRSGTGIRFAVIDKGRANTDTDKILNRLESYLDKYHPDMVVAMMGVNDPGAAHLPAETPSASKPALFVKSFKTYKLTRLLFHMAFKINRWALPPEDTQAQSIPRSALPEIGSDAENAELAKKLKKVLELDPGNDRACLKLGRLYIDQQKFQQAEIYMKKALKLNPGNNKETYHELGWLYQKLRKFQQAEKEFKKALRINPGNDWAYFRLGELYKEQGKLQQAEQEFKKALELNPGNSRARYGIEGIYWKRGQFHQAEAPYYLEYNPFTTNNYHALKAILDRRKIRLVCAQYPMRNVAPLKNIFAGQADDIAFVDNEKIFREAVKKEGYGAYFRDIVGGNFGHCTDNGNKLLGENIAGVILRKVFHKKFPRNKT